MTYFHELCSMIEVTDNMDATDLFIYLFIFCYLSVVNSLSSLRTNKNDIRVRFVRLFFRVFDQADLSLHAFGLLHCGEI